MRLYISQKEKCGEWNFRMCVSILVGFIFLLNGCVSLNINHIKPVYQKNSPSVERQVDPYVSFQKKVAASQSQSSSRASILRPDPTTGMNADDIKDYVNYGLTPNPLKERKFVRVEEDENTGLKKAIKFTYQSFKRDNDKDSEMEVQLIGSHDHLGGLFQNVDTYEIPHGKLLEKFVDLEKDIDLLISEHAIEKRLDEAENGILQRNEETAISSRELDFIKKCFYSEREFTISKFEAKNFHHHSHCYINKTPESKDLAFDVDKFNVFQQESYNEKIELDDDEIKEITNIIAKTLNIPMEYIGTGCALQSNERAKLMIQGFMIEAEVILSENLVSKCEGIPSIDLFKNDVLKIKFPLTFFTTCLVGNSYCSGNADSNGIYSLITL